MTSVALKEAKAKVVELSTKALAVAENKDGTYKSFTDQKAALDPLETDIKHWEEEVQNLEEIEVKRAKFQKGAGSLDEASEEERKKAVRGSLGKQFVESAGYKAAAEAGLFKKGSFTTGAIELKDFLSEGTADAQGGGYAPANFNPLLIPGITQLPFRPLTIADLFPQGSTDSPLISFLEETVAENGAAQVKEGELAPLSNLKFAKAQETLHDIKTFLPVTDDMLEDYPQIQSYIDARLALFVGLAEEDALLNSDGSDDTLTGILQRTGLAPTVIRGTAPSASDDNAMDAVYRQITQIRTTQFLEPDAIGMDPIGWEGITLAKNTQGNYYANGPFMSQQVPTLWGKKVATSSAFDENTALVGAFAAAAQLFRKGGLNVTASNSHADYFQRSVTAIRAVLRTALVVYRPGAFGIVEL